MSKKNIFNTLNEALEAEGVLEIFPVGYNLNYGQVIRFAKSGTFVTVTRFENGTYERPIKYATKCDDFVVVC